MRMRKLRACESQDVVKHHVCLTSDNCCIIQKKIITKELLLSTAATHKYVHGINSICHWQIELIPRKYLKLGC